MFFHVRKWESQKPLPFSRKHIHIVPRDKLKTHLKETQKMIFIFLKEDGKNFRLKIILKEIEGKKKRVLRKGIGNWAPFGRIL